ncbi:right-handed parallel beta-helix repeat-containing protein [bacterium]|nr:right-handed parallel beta-helix repeat-containing protein [bacterium]
MFRHFITAALMLFPLSGGATPSVFDVSDYGAVGDGRTDDGPAVRKTIDAALKSGPGATVVFPEKTYRLGKTEGGGAQIALRDVEGLRIEGNGSLLILHPHNGVFEINGCRNVTVTGFRIDFDPLPFTQGTIRAVQADPGYFDLEIHEGYPLPPSDEAMKSKIGEGAWQWGSVIDPAERHRRWDVSPHYFIESVTPVPGADRAYRVQVKPDYVKHLSPVKPGDRFFLPLMLTPEGDTARGTNMWVHRSADCAMENITVYTGRSGMVWAVTGNEGPVAFRNNRIEFKPGSDRICTTWKDGVHVKDNRVGPLFENCYFEGMLDDSINLSANTGMAEEVVSETEFVLMGAGFRVDDEVMVYDPVSGRILAETRVTEISTENKRRIFTLADPIPGVITGTKRPHTDIESTHFYNMSYANRGFIVRNCTFMPQRRHAILVRSCDGLIEGNTMDGVGGSAVEMANEVGWFYAGPFPRNNIIRNNTIRNTQATAIRIYSTKGAHVRNIQALDNTITVLPGKAGIFVSRAQDVLLKGNRILDQEGNAVGEKGVEVAESKNVVIELARYSISRK